MFFSQHFRTPLLLPIANLAELVKASVIQNMVD
jgi:hypothetical protein